VGISLSELTVIFLVALVLFGPERLPELARALGKVTGQLRKTSDSLRREFYNSVYPPGQDLRRDITRGIEGLRSVRAEALEPFNLAKNIAKQGLATPSEEEVTSATPPPNTTHGAPSTKSGGS
jgi:Tat protein translocase TatB subunit